MTEFVFDDKIREVIKKALPDDTSLHGTPPELRYTYLPAAHVRALRPENMLVVGIRGAGKSFWWSVLQDEANRAVIGSAIGLGRKTQVSAGFGEKPAPDHFPGKDAINALLQKGFETRFIWKTIIFRHIAQQQSPENFRRLETWAERTAWLKDNAEAVENIIYKADEKLESEGIHHLVLFDALDRSANDWTVRNRLLRELLQIALEFRPYRKIRLKVFVRPDQMEAPEVTYFPDSSKILSSKTDLYWPRHELYALLWQYLSNADDGEVFREGTSRMIGVRWQQSEGIWMVPEELRDDEQVQRRILHSITGPYMGRDRRRGFPYTWLPDHLRDTRNEVSPRSFLAAVRHAALVHRQRPDQQNPLHYEDIKHGVQAASQIRVQEMKEDYPWVQHLLKPLSAISVPCPIKDIEHVWTKGKVLEILKQEIEEAEERVLPPNIARGTEGVLKDLIDLGLMQQVSGNRINIPDVYRVGYGIGRRGGVKPAAMKAGTR